MIKLQKSTFYNEDDTKRKLVDFILSAKTLSMGEECRKFEEAFAKKQGRRFAVLVNSGSSANLLLLQALINSGRLKPGTRVGVSAVTWATNVMPVVQLGFKPIPIDCELDTLNVSPEILESKISGLDALFLTNTLGFSDDIEAIATLCRKRGVIFLEDNCESLGSSVGGKLLGNFGLAATFSFYVGHHLSTVEGGMVITDDADLYEALVVARAHGWDRQLAPERQAVLREQFAIDPFFAKYTFYELGYNLRPTEITGFLGNIQLGYWDEIVGKRIENFRRFHQAVSANDDLVPINIDHMDSVSNFGMPLIAKTAELFSKYRERFEQGQVEIRPVIAGDITNHPFWKKHVKTTAVCPNARLVHQQGFYFGNNPELTSEEITTLVSLIKK